MLGLFGGTLCCCWLLGIGMLNVGRGISSPGNYQSFCVGSFLGLLGELCFFFLGFLGSLFLGESYHVSGNSFSASSFVGIGVLLLVFRWWICFVPRTTLGAVVSCDVLGAPTLGGLGASTLGGGRFLRILVSCCNIFACSIFNCVGRDAVSSKTWTNSAAAISVLSSSDMLGMVQWAGNNFVVLAILIPRVFSIQNLPQR